MLPLPSDIIAASDVSTLGAFRRLAGGKVCY